MEYKVNETIKPSQRTFVVELWNETTQTTALTEVVTDVLNIEELIESIPSDYKFVTFWVKD